MRRKTTIFSVSTTFSIYRHQRNNAKRRNILWELTYIQWRLVWARSGHWRERGRGKGQYCMARFGDRGSYNVSNVKICTVEENNKEAHTGNNYRRGKKLSLETRKKMSKSKIGKPSNHLGKKMSLSLEIRLVSL